MRWVCGSPGSCRKKLISILLFSLWRHLDFLYSAYLAGGRKCWVSLIPYFHCQTSVYSPFWESHSHRLMPSSSSLNLPCFANHFYILWIGSCFSMFFHSNWCQLSQVFQMSPWPSTQISDLFFFNDLHFHSLLVCGQMLRRYNCSEMSYLCNLKPNSGKLSSNNL